MCVAAENGLPGMGLAVLFRLRWASRSAAYFEDAFPEHRASSDADVGIWIFAIHSIPLRHQS